MEKETDFEFWKKLGYDTMVHSLSVPVLVVKSSREDEKFTMCNFEETKKYLGDQGIVCSGKTIEEAEKKFWAMYASVREWEHKRSNDLDKWHPLQIGPWGLGGKWFSSFGIGFHFRTGDGMLGGWYVPLTRLNISVSNAWRRK